MRNAGNAIVDVLATGGVQRFYTVPGESFLEVLDAAEQHPDVRLISTRHESGASFMAEADAKLTGVPAVCMATRGVGASNLAIGVHTAHQDSTPMVVLLGQVESEHLHREALQEVDLTAFYTPITKWAVTASRADRMAELVDRGLRIATAGRPGPVVIALPADLLGQPVTTAPSSLQVHRGGIGATPVPSAEETRSVTQRLAAAERPVIIAGGGARFARDSLVAVAESFGVGVYAAFRRQDVFPNDHPLYLGHLSIGAPPATLQALEDADLVLVVGCRLGSVTTQGYRLPAPTVDVVQIDASAEALGASVPVVQGVVGDAGTALAALLEHAPPDVTRDWSAAHQSWVESATVPESQASTGVDPAQVIAAMADVLPADAVLTNDAGNFAGFLHRYWWYRHPQTQLAPTSGAMGYAVPAAVAAKLAAPERTVVAVVGDGGFTMTGQEVETAVRCGAPILVVAFRNGLYGTIAMHQAQAFGRMAATDIGEVDLAGYARALGATGVTVTSQDQLRPALRAALENPGVHVLDVVTDPDLISPSARLSDLQAAAVS